MMRPALDILCGVLPALAMVALFFRHVWRARRKQKREREHLRKLAIAMVRAYEIADEEERWG